MTPDTRKDASESPGNGAVWLSVSDAAAALGVSVRTVKRWIENGEVETRKDGARRLVLLPEKRDTEGTKRGTLGTPKKEHERDKGDTAPDIHAQKEGHSEGTQGTRAVPLSSEREEELKEEISFLRGIVESDRRDMAELRAALREALKAMPKALTSGAASGDSQTTATAPEAPTATAISPDVVLPVETPSGPQNGASGREFSSYGALADFLEGEILER